MIHDKDLDCLTVHQVALLLKLDNSTVRRWIKTGLLDAIKLPTNSRPIYRIKRSTIVNIIEGNRYDNNRNQH